MILLEEMAAAVTAPEFHLFSILLWARHREQEKDQLES